MKNDGWLPHALRKIISTCLKWYLLWRQAFLCVRMSVRHSRWSTPPNLNEAIKDLQPRPVDEGALSIYIVGSLKDASRIAIFHQVTQKTPESTCFLIAPFICFCTTPVDLQIVPSWDFTNMHPLLNLHHCVVFGLDSARTQKDLATSILGDSGHLLKRWTKKEVQRLAAPLLKQKAIRR